MRALYSYGVAAVIVVAGAAWLATGTLVTGGNGPGNGERPIISLIDKDAEVAENTHHGDVDPHQTIAERVAAASGETAPLQSVRTSTFTVQPMPIEVPLRGRTKAKSLAVITPETTGVVAAVNVTKGQAVKAGDLLCRLDQGTRAAAVTQAEAAVAQAQSASDANQALREKGLAASNTGIVLEAALRQAQTSLILAQAELARTEVKTQVAGIVQDPLATVGTMLSPGQPCATVVELDPMLFIGTIPEARIGQAKLGLPAKIETVTGQTVEGKVSLHRLARRRSHPLVPGRDRDSEPGRQGAVGRHRHGHGQYRHPAGPSVAAVGADAQRRGHAGRPHGQGRDGGVLSRHHRLRTRATACGSPACPRRWR